jgi:hypothetical protein
LKANPLTICLLLAGWLPRFCQAELVGPYKPDIR